MTEDSTRRGSGRRRGLDRLSISGHPVANEVAIKALVARRELDTDGPVPYEWLVQAGRRDLDMDRPTVETAVESLVDHGELEKRRAEYLAIATE